MMDLQLTVSEVSLIRPEHLVESSVLLGTLDLVQ